MANPYDIIAPPSLTNLNAVVANPAGTEAANLADDYLRQVKKFIFDFLTLTFTDDPTQPVLLPDALAAASLAGLVSGSTANTAGTQRGIVQGTVSAVDLRDLSVQTNKLDNQAVTTAKLADASVTTDKIVAGAVTAATIATGTITSTQLAANAIVTAAITSKAVTTDKIDDEAVTGTQIAANTVTPAELVNATGAGYILVGSATTPYPFAAVAVSGDATLSAAGVLTLITSGIVELEERANRGTACGGATITAWNTRGTATAWTKTYDTLTSSFLTNSSGSPKVFLSAGTYFISAAAPGYKVGLHQLRIARYNGSNVFIEAVWGSSETAPLATAAADSVQTRSTVSGKVTFAAGDYFQLEHYTTLAEAVDGLGLPVTAPATNGEVVYEVYAQARIQKFAS